jgi:hypothetical protein
MHYHLLSDDLSLDFACNELIEFSSVSDKYSSYVCRIQKNTKKEDPRMVRCGKKEEYLKDNELLFIISKSCSCLLLAAAE